MDCNARPHRRGENMLQPHAGRFTPSAFLAGILAICAIESGAADAQPTSYPNKPITLIVPYTPGAGGPQHLAMEFFMQETGTELVHVPYKGTAGALTDVIGGHVQASIVSLQTSGNFVNSGQLRMLAVMSEARAPAFPNVPTLKELGLPTLVVDTWYGVLAPAGTPQEVVAKINTGLGSILQLPDIREAFAKQGLLPVGGKPERLRDLLALEIARWTRVVATAKIKTE